MGYSVGGRRKSSSSSRNSTNRNRSSNNLSPIAAVTRAAKKASVKAATRAAAKSIQPNEQIVLPKTLRINSNRSMVINGVPISKQDFVRIVQNYSNDPDYQKNFGQYAERIYEICARNNINPMLAFAQAKTESQFGASVPTNSPWNYWGLGVENDSQEGIEFNSIDEAVDCYCKTLIDYQTNPNSIAADYSSYYAPYNKHFTGDVSNVYELFSPYMFLGYTHNGTMWYNDEEARYVRVKEFLDTYVPEVGCNHGQYDNTTIEEQGAYVVYYVDNVIIDEIENTFGDSAFVKTGVNNQGPARYES